MRGSQWGASRAGAVIEEAHRQACVHTPSVFEAARARGNPTNSRCWVLKPCRERSGHFALRHFTRTGALRTGAPGRARKHRACERGLGLGELRPRCVTSNQTGGGLRSGHHCSLHRTSKST